jgi:hypothetical protein
MCHLDFGVLVLKFTSAALNNMGFNLIDLDVIEVSLVLSVMETLATLSTSASPVVSLQHVRIALCATVV